MFSTAIPLVMAGSCAPKCGKRAKEYQARYPQRREPMCQWSRQIAIEERKRARGERVGARTFAGAALGGRAFYLKPIGGNHEDQRFHSWVPSQP